MSSTPKKKSLTHEVSSKSEAIVEKKSTSSATSKSQELHVIYNGESVQANIDIFDYSFSDIDTWIRSRFGLHANDKLRYMDKLGAEVIPTKKLLEESQYYVYVQKIKSQDKPRTIDYTPYVFLLLTITLCFIGLYANEYFPEIFPVRRWCEVADDHMMAMGLYHKKGIALEAFMAVICWSTTYLFIRRLWNAETRKDVFLKYSADSFFGGLAAGGAIIMKNVLLHTLAEKKF